MQLLKSVLMNLKWGQPLQQRLGEVLMRLIAPSWEAFRDLRCYRMLLWGRCSASGFSARRWIGRA